VALRQEYAKPIFDDLEVWLKEQLGKVGSPPLMLNASRNEAGCVLSSTEANSSPCPPQQVFF
jgi:hypothetical protein